MTSPKENQDRHSSRPPAPRRKPRARSPKGKGKPVARFESHREFLVQNVYRIEEILRALHGQPTHGNKADPLDELVYIMLSRKTRESGYETAFNGLKRRFRSWGDLLLVDPAEIEKTISSAGLGRIRTRALLNNLKRIRREFGRVTLDPLRSWPDLSRGTAEVTPCNDGEPWETNLSLRKPEMCGMSAIGILPLVQDEESPVVGR